MDGTGACLAAAAVAMGFGMLPDAAIDQRQVSQVRVDDERSLMDSLLDLAQRRLRPAGLSLDRTHAQMTLSGAGVPAGVFEVRARWSADPGPPQQPLVFELRPVAENGAGAGAPRDAYLAAPLMRDTLVAVHRLRKGTPLRCDDFALEPRPVRGTRGPAPAQPCRDDAGQAVLRDLGAGDVVRADDIGAPYAVMAGSQVVVTAEQAGITVSTIGTASVDARMGERIDVRLQHPTRTVAVRVTGNGTAQLMEEIPQ